jgi:hypothetical protein
MGVLAVRRLPHPLNNEQGHCEICFNGQAAPIPATKTLFWQPHPFDGANYGVAFQKRTVPSAELVSMYFLSGVNTIRVTADRCPYSKLRAKPVYLKTPEP